MKTAETRKEVEQLPRKNWLTDYVGANSSHYLSYAEGLIPLRPFTKEVLACVWCFNRISSSPSHAKYKLQQAQNV